MLNYTPTLVSELETIGLPVHFELFLKQNTKVPCISYQEGNNMAQAEGDEFGYSEVNYRIKVWATTKKEIAQYSQEIDRLMRKLGFTRVSTNELWQGTIGQNLMVYRGLGVEDFN